MTSTRLPPSTMFTCALYVRSGGCHELQRAARRFGTAQRAVAVGIVEVERRRDLRLRFGALDAAVAVGVLRAQVLRQLRRRRRHREQAEQRLVTDDARRVLEHGCARRVVGVRVAVDHVLHRHAEAPLQLALEPGCELGADGLDEHDAVRRHHERRDDNRRCARNRRRRSACRSRGPCTSSIARADRVAPLRWTHTRTPNNPVRRERQPFDSSRLPLERVWLPGSYRITSIAVDCDSAGSRGRNTNEKIDSRRGDRLARSEHRDGAAGTAARDDVLRDERQASARAATWAASKARMRIARRSRSNAGAGEKTWRAYLERHGFERQRRDQRARSHRPRPVAQRERRSHRARRRRPAFRQRQHHGRHRHHEKGRSSRPSRISTTSSRARRATAARGISTCSTT